MSLERRRPGQFMPFLIKTILATRRNMSPYRMWKEYNRYMAILNREPIKFKSFYNYINYLRRLGLIRKTIQVQSPIVPHLNLTIYEITPGREDDPLWEKNIQREIAVRSGWKPTWLGAHRYRRRILGIPPRPRGRPRKEG